MHPKPRPPRCFGCTRDRERCSRRTSRSRWLGHRKKHKDFWLEIILPVSQSATVRRHGMRLLISPNEGSVQLQIEADYIYRESFWELFFSMDAPQILQIVAPRKWVNKHRAPRFYHLRTCGMELLHHGRMMTLHVEILFPTTPLGVSKPMPKRWRVQWVKRCRPVLAR